MLCFSSLNFSLDFRPCQGSASGDCAAVPVVNKGEEGPGSRSGLV